MIKHLSQNLFLIGPMAAGKTTIGRILAQELALEFIDSDQEIERRAGTNIAWVFDVEGEEGFRQRETTVIEDLTKKSGILLATGGGSILRPENRRYFVSRGIVVFLDTSVELQIKRTEKDTKRPLLQTMNQKQLLTELRRRRHPLYQEIADITVFVGEEAVRQVAQEIIHLLSEKELLR